MALIRIGDSLVNSDAVASVVPFREYQGRLQGYFRVTLTNGKGFVAKEPQISESDLLGYAKYGLDYQFTVADIRDMFEKGVWRDDVEIFWECSLTVRAVLDETGT
jgi:hypothetical protein